MKKLFTFLFVLVCLNIWAQKTYVYFQNNTTLNFSVSCTQTGDHVMESSEWWGMSGNLIPFQANTNVLWTNRDAGVHWGNTFYHTVSLTSGGETVQLKLKMVGNLVGSTIWASSSGPGYSHPWYSDNTFHSASFTMNGKAMTIKYAFYFTGGYDDILYTIQEADPFAVGTTALADARKVNVLSYNAYMRPSELFFDDQDIRSKYYDEALLNYDAIIFQELFDDDERTELLGYLAAEYPYQTTVVDIPNHGALDPVQDGGVLVVSRWPIEAQDQMLFGNNCWEDDCLAYKGFKYAKINKLGVKYHIFGTHMDAFNELEDVNMRKTQLQMAKTFIASKSIPTTEAVLFGGDLNIDKITNKWGEYDSLWTPFFGAVQPSYIGAENASWDSDKNHYLVSSSDPKEYLDYVLPMGSHLVPNVNTNKVAIYRTIADEMWKIFDLSDHYAVQGHFEYPGTSPSCSAISGLAVSGITQTDANLSWSAVSGAAGFNVRYKPVATSTWTNTTSTTNSKALSGLTAGTAYEAQVQTNCGGLLYSTWSTSVNFTTASAACTDVYETNETSSTAKTIATNTDINAKIGTSTDIDWFKFSTTSGATRVKINLSNLPANYNVQLYSGNTLLGSGTNTGTTSEQIIYNTNKAKNYTVKVFGVSGATNAACYTLRASTSASNFRTMEPDAETILAEENQVNIFPNPVSSKFMMEFSLESDIPVEVSLYNIYGQLVSVEIFDGTKGANAIYKNVQDLAAGIYMVTLSSQNQILYNGKIVKQ
ncbi:MAG: T9SS type A sorting domain-containing protein [Chitinophagales bacterium]|nr:T9SS type A sorting domain-containing protein [Chitinophagales bacterium]